MLINKIWNAKNFPLEASSGSLGFHPVLGKLWAEGEHHHDYMVCYGLQSLADLTKLCNHDFNFVNETGKAGFGAELQWLSHNHIIRQRHIYITV